VIKSTLTAMTLADVQRMISERLRRAGCHRALFDPSAVQLIYERSGGMPRRVTVLCLSAMWMAYQEGKRYISKDVMCTAIEQYSGRDLLATSAGIVIQVKGSRSGQAQPHHSWHSRLLHQLRRFLGYAEHSAN
jgi:hypothetical protein